jgi:hypothetical protein
MVPLDPPINRHMDLILLGVSDCEWPEVICFRFSLFRVLKTPLLCAKKDFLAYLDSSLSHLPEKQAAPMRAVRDKYAKSCE